MKRIDLTGERFGRLLVKSFSHKSKGRYVMWFCLCDCGKYHVTSTNSLRSGDCQSCGCIVERARAMQRGTSALRALFASYKTNAKAKKRAFSISLKEFSVITSSNCVYCGTEPTRVFNPGSRMKIGYTYNGVDRVDSARGYEPDNIVPCCWWCNIMKRNASTSDFLTHVAQIGKHQNG